MLSATQHTDMHASAEGLDGPPASEEDTTFRFEFSREVPP